MKLIAAMLVVSVLCGCGTKCVICGKRFSHKTHYVRLMGGPTGPMCDEDGRKCTDKESEKWYED